MKIAFHDNSISLRGTTVALFDFAYYNQVILGNESVIIYDKHHAANTDIVYNKFNEHFPIYNYSNFDTEFDEIIKAEKCDASLFVKCGQWDGKISKICKNLINSIAICSTSDIHGDVFATGSEWLSKITNYQIPSVPYMINIPDINEDLRSELNIPKDAVVFGRNGGSDTFDIDFVKTAINNVLNIRHDIYFIFQNTDRFTNHPRIIHINGSADMEYKVKFINTCDAMIHARHIGESFGLSCGEFSTRNKRVITYYISPERNHIDILGEKGIYYSDYNSIFNILKEFRKEEGDFNCYREYTPEKIMTKFKNTYL